ncbi:MAG: uracil-DNA glycosylase [Gammaproteobacteria bacterium]
MSAPVSGLSSRQLAALDAMDITVWTGRAEHAGAAVPAVAASPDWNVLEQEALGCTKCALHATRTRVVFGVGDRRAAWMVIGEAPGADEDRQGEPFVGRAGQLLNEMLRAAGVRREQVYIANILKCRPPENRDPKPEESASCDGYLQRQIALVQPGLLLAVGRIAAQNLLRVDTPIGQLRGQVHRYGPTGIPLVVTYHPAYLLRSPGQKRKSWEDLCLARTTVPPLRAPAPSGPAVAPATAAKDER